MEYFVLYLCIVNALGFALMLVDKKKAIRGQWRIPEDVLMAVVIVGGSLGGFLGMYSCRHKTRKAKFALGIPLMLLIHAIAIALLLMQ